MQLRDEIEELQDEAGGPEGPRYTCPNCRVGVVCRPHQVYGFKGVARAVAEAKGEAVKEEVGDLLSGFFLKVQVEDKEEED